MKEQTFCCWTTLGKKSSSLYPTFFACVSEWLQFPLKISVTKWRCQQKNKYNWPRSNIRHCFLSLFKTSASFSNSWSLLTNCQAALRYTNPMCQKQLTGQPWITCTDDLAILFDQVTGPGFLKGRVFCSTFNTLFNKLILNMQYLALWPLNYLKGLERWLGYVCVYI